SVRQLRSTSRLKRGAQSDTSARHACYYSCHSERSEESLIIFIPITAREETEMFHLAQHDKIAQWKSFPSEIPPWLYGCASNSRMRRKKRWTRSCKYFGSFEALPFQESLNLRLPTSQSPFSMTRCKLQRRAGSRIEYSIG